MLRVEVSDEQVTLTDDVQNAVAVKTGASENSLAYSVSFFSKRVNKKSWGVFSSPLESKPIFVAPSEEVALANAIEFNATCAANYFMDELEQIMDEEITHSSSASDYYGGTWKKKQLEEFRDDVLDRLRLLLESELSEEVTNKVKGI